MEFGFCYCFSWTTRQPGLREPIRQSFLSHGTGFFPAKPTLVLALDNGSSAIDSTYIGSFPSAGGTGHLGPHHLYPVVFQAFFQVDGPHLTSAGKLSGTWVL